MTPPRGGKRFHTTYSATCLIIHRRGRLPPWPLFSPALPSPTAQSPRLTGLVFRENAQRLGFDMAAHAYEADRFEGGEHLIGRHASLDGVPAVSYTHLTLPTNR